MQMGVARVHFARLLDAGQAPDRAQNRPLALSAGRFGPRIRRIGAQSSAEARRSGARFRTRATGGLHLSRFGPRPTGGAGDAPCQSWSSPPLHLRIDAAWPLPPGAASAPCRMGRSVWSSNRRVPRASCALRPSIWQYRGMGVQWKSFHPVHRPWRDEQPPGLLGPRDGRSRWPISWT